MPRKPLQRIPKRRKPPMPPTVVKSIRATVEAIPDPILKALRNPKIKKAVRRYLETPRRR